MVLLDSFPSRKAIEVGSSFTNRGESEIQMGGGRRDRQEDETYVCRINSNV